MRLNRHILVRTPSHPPYDATPHTYPVMPAQALTSAPLTSRPPLQEHCLAFLSACSRVTPIGWASCC